MTIVNEIIHERSRHLALGKMPFKIYMSHEYIIAISKASGAIISKYLGMDVCEYEMPGFKIESFYIICKYCNMNSDKVICPSCSAPKCDDHYMIAKGTI